MLLTATVFLPLAGALVIVATLRGRQARLFAVAVAIADFILAALVFGLYDHGANAPDFQLANLYDGWVPLLGKTFIRYSLAVDGLSAPLVLLTGLLGLAAIFSSWSIDHRHKEYFAWLLVLQTAVMGVFTAQDFILFFIFWELELVPMFFLISIWGSGRKEYSAMKFLIFTFVGSAFMLVGILALYFSEGVGTFNMMDLAKRDLTNLLLPSQVVFALFFIAFAVKLPLWPLHTWLPDAHTDAPTAVSVMLAGVLLKMGGYGLMRVNLSMFPEVSHAAALALAVLAVINILYGAMVTLRQSDLKRLIAYSSISHMGYVVLGVSSVGAAGAATTVGLTGAAMQMFTHGTITGLLFVMVGLVYDKLHTRHIPDLGGLASRMPFVAAVFVVAGLASLGLPTTSGFVSELMVFLGAFPVHGVLTTLGVVGILLTAGYILWTLQRSLFGPALPRWAGVHDATLVEAVAPALLVVAIMAVGIYPAFLTDVFGPGIEAITKRFAGLS
jgi:NADH-quinone oxidoreductase subunit M